MLLLMLLICTIDSSFVARHVSYNQWIANIITFGYFIWMYRNATDRMRRVMKYAVVVATTGEVFFCLLIGMYEYRLENIPLYVPPGHAILYCAVWYLSRDPLLVKYKSAVIKILLAISASYAIGWFFVASDTYGLLCSILFLLLLAGNPDSRLFFIVMFLSVAYLEQVGTRLECWFWHPTLLNNPQWIASGNPPSGISIFYFGLDILCFWIYLLRNRTTNLRWRSIRRLRRSHQAN